MAEARPRKTPRLEEQQVEQLFTPRPRNTTSARRGPRNALEALQFSERNGSEVNEWLEEARIDANLGFSRLSLKSVKSGVRCYIAFVGALALGPLFGASNAMRLQMQWHLGVESISHRISIYSWLGQRCSDPRALGEITAVTSKPLASS